MERAKCCFLRGVTNLAGSLWKTSARTLTNFARRGRKCLQRSPGPSPAGCSAMGEHREVDQKFRAVREGFCAKWEKVSAGYYVMASFVLK